MTRYKRKPKEFMAEQYLKGKKMRGVIYKRGVPRIRRWRSKKINEGDWIVIDSKGRIHLYTPEEFEKRFEPIDPIVGEF